MAEVQLSILQTFQKHIDDMRNLALCKICLQPFYEPFVLPCGHTYCYSCLTSWLAGSHNRERQRNCPDCRAEVTTEPCPNYLLRDLVHMFISRAELLPEDETVQEHERAKQVEANILATDRTGRGLFKGIFRDRLPQRLRAFLSRRFHGPIEDPEDNVVRCPHCTWELEDGICTHCNWGAPDNNFSTEEEEEESNGSILSSGTDSEIDDDMDPPDDDLIDQMDDGYFGHPIGPDVLGAFGDSDVDRESLGGRNPYEDDDDSGDMDSFIDDDSIRTMTWQGDRSASEGIQSPPTYDSQSDASGTGPIEFYGVNQYEGDGSSYGSGGSLAHHYSPDEYAEQDTNYDESDDESVRILSPPPEIQGVRRRRNIISDDEEGDDSERELALQNDGQSAPSESEREESEQSDSTAVRPPQPSANRRQHLMNQRSRRAMHSRQPYGRGNNLEHQRSQSPQVGNQHGSNNLWTRRGRPSTTRVH